LNKSLLDKAGVAPPANKDWKVTDLEQIVRKAADPGNGIFGFSMNLASPLYAAQALRSWSSTADKSSDDSWLVSRDGKKQQLDSPPVKTGYEWYWKMVKDGLVPTSADAAAMTSAGINHFIAGKIVAQAAELLSPTTWLEKIQGKFETIQVLWPKGPNGHRGSALSYNNQMVYSQTKQQEAALKLLNVLTGPEIAFQRGFEGVGQPGARNSAWSNPKMWEKFPITKDGAEWLNQGVDPYPRPWNLRAQEHQEIYAQEIQAYLDGKEDWNQMFAHVQPKGQEIIDMPRP
jgi:ABC-type glycerol-3-phosphate transport system substrate-binding protein